jgi:hypothetical protein
LTRSFNGKRSFGVEVQSYAKIELPKRDETAGKLYNEEQSKLGKHLNFSNAEIA